MISSDPFDVPISSFHEIKIHQDGSFHDADNQKSKDTAIPSQAFQPCVHGMAAPHLACTASIRVQELQSTHPKTLQYIRNDAV